MEIKKYIAPTLLATTIAGFATNAITTLSNDSFKEARDISNTCREDISTCTDGIEEIKFVFNKEAQRQEKEKLTQSIFHSELSAINDKLMKTYLNSGNYRKVNTKDKDMDFCQGSNSPFGRYVVNTKNETGDICTDAERLPTGYRNIDDKYLSI